MNKYLSSQKLWRVIKERDAWYYEVKLAGTIVDRVKIEEPALTFLKSAHII